MNRRLRRASLALNPTDPANTAVIRREAQLVDIHDVPEVTGIPGHESDDFKMLLQYLSVLWRNKWLLIGSLLLGALGGLAVSLWTVPMYRAKASLEIQSVQEPFTGPMVTSNPTVGTQAQLLNSMALRDKTVARVRSHPGTAEPKNRGLLTSLRSLLKMKDPVKSIDWDTATGMASQAFSVTPPKDGNLLFIQTDSPNPQVSADFVNALAQEYLASNESGRWEAYQNASSWLTRAQQDLKARLEQSEIRMAEFAQSKGLMLLSGSENVSEDKLKGLQMALMTATSERIAKQAAYESSLSSPMEALPSVLDSGPMASYQVELAKLRRELAQLNTTLTPSHYKTQQVAAQIEQLEKDATRERSNIINRIKIDYDAALKREAQLRRDFDGQTQFLSQQSKDVIQYKMLEREVQTNRTLYEATLAQGKQASLASAMRTSGARLIDLAKVPGAPVRPNLPLNLALGMFGGLICGAAVIAVRAGSDLRIQTPGIVEAQLNVRQLGVIPAMASDTALYSKRRERALSSAVTSLVKKRLNPQDSRNYSADYLAQISWKDKLCVTAEAYRSVITSLLFSADDANRPRVIVVSSASPQEGKSTVVSNLAIALAEIGHRVLLIDGDMRIPRLHAIYEVPNTFGLSDLLYDRKPIREYPDDALVRKTAVPDLALMPSGPARAVFPRLLHSPRTEELLNRLLETYDTILIDSPPVLSVPDARILARSADGVVLVIRAHRTQQAAAFAAARCFIEDGSAILGTVLNGWNPKASAYGASHYNAEYYRPTV
jgi:polysaccharide biosynthesis transport protein